MSETLGVGHLTTHELGDGQVDAGQHQERTQGDEEAGNLRLHDEVAVEESDGERDDQRQNRAHPTG